MKSITENTAKRSNVPDMRNGELIRTENTSLMPIKLIHKEALHRDVMTPTQKNTSFQREASHKTYLDLGSETSH